MKQKPLFRTLLVCLLLMVGVSAWAEEVVYTLDTSLEANKGTNNSYANSGEVTVDDITWNATGNMTMLPWRIGGKSLNSVDRVVYTKTAYPSALQTVSLTVGAATATINSIKMQYASKADFSDAVTINASGKAASITYDFTITDGFPANTYFKFIFNVSASGSSNKYVEFSKVEFKAPSTLPADKTLIGIEAKGTPADLWKDDSFSPEGITVWATWDDESETDVTDDCSFAGYDMSVPGNQTVIVTYSSETTTYDITVRTIKNDEASAYTVAEARDILDAGKDLASEVYVKGIVSQIDRFYDADGTLNYWMSDDGTTNGQMEMYKGKGLYGQKFTAIDDVTIGQEIVVRGTLAKFNEVYEFAAGNWVASMDQKATLSIEDISVANGADIIPEIVTNVPEGNYLIEYVSDNEDVVLAADDEMITMGVGTANITATLAADGYRTVSTTFTVTVLSSASISELFIEGAPSKTVYKLGESFDTTGLTVTVRYSDATSADVTEAAEWVIDPEEFTTTGLQEVEVLVGFGGELTSEKYNVEVALMESSIAIENKTIGLGGMFTITPVVTPEDAVITYDVVDGIGVVELDGNKVMAKQAGKATIVAMFDGDATYAPTQTTFDVTVENCYIATITSFETIYGDMNADISYSAHKGSSTSDPIVYANNNCLRLYQGGGYVTISTEKLGVRISEVILTTGSTYASTTIGVAVENADEPTTGTEVAGNSTFTKSDLNCNSISFYCLGADKNSRLDIASIVVKYKKENSVVTSLSIEGAYTTEFFKGAAFNHDGLIVKAYYSTGETRTVTDLVEFSAPNMNQVGEQEVTITLGEVSISYPINVIASDYIFYESFNTNMGKGGNDGSFGGSVATSSSYTTDNSGWNITSGYCASQCVKMGTGSAKGSAQTPTIEFSGSAEISFRAAPWTGDNLNLTISATSGTLETTTVAMTSGEWADFKIKISDVDTSTRITISAAQTSKNRFFLDEIKVSLVEDGDDPLEGDYDEDGDLDVDDVTTLANMILNGEGGHSISELTKLVEKLLEE